MPAPKALPPKPPPAPPTPPAEPTPPPPVDALRAPLTSITQEAEAAIDGHIQLRAAADAVDVQLQASGLPPGPKAVHIHEKADCSDVANGSAGSHFAPEGQIHGLPDSANHHRGDLGDLVADEAGVGTLKLRIARVSLQRGAHASLLGRALVIRSRPDDGLGLRLGKPLACAELRDPHDAAAP